MNSISETKELVSKFQKEAEEYKKKELDTSRTTEAKAFGLGALEAVETIFDTIGSEGGSTLTSRAIGLVTEQFADEEGMKKVEEDTPTLKKITGIDTKQIEKDIEDKAIMGKMTTGQKLVKEIPSEIAAVYGTNKISKAIGLAKKFKQANTISKINEAGKYGAIENVIASGLSQDLQEEGKTSLSDTTPSNLATATAVGYGIGAAIPLSTSVVTTSGKAIAGASDLVARTSKEVANKTKKFKDDYKARMDSDGNSIFSKLDPTARKSEDVVMAKRVGRTATRIATRLAGREIEHMYHTFKDIGKEIYQESADLVKTKYKNVKNIDINKVAEEVVNNVKNKPRKPNKSDNGKINEKVTNDKGEVEKSFVDDLPNSYMEKITKSDFIQSSKERFESISSSKVFTDDLFSTYVEIGGKKAKQALEDLDKIYVTSGSIAKENIKEAIGKVFNSVDEKLGIKRSRPNDLKDILKPMEKDINNGSKVDSNYEKAFQNIGKLNTIKSYKDIDDIYKQSSKVNAKDADKFEAKFEAKDAYTIGLIKEKDKQLINKLVELSDNPNVYVTKGDMKYSGLYNTKTNEISINPNTTWKGSHNLKHELFHAATINQINKYPKLSKELDDIYNNTLKNVEAVESTGKKIDTSSKQWRDNRDEFFAEAMTNPKVMKAIEKASSKNTGLLNKIKSLIMRALRGQVPPKQVNDLFNKLYKEDVINTGRKTTKLSSEQRVKKPTITQKLDKAVSKELDKAEKSVSKTLKETNLFNVQKDGSVKIIGFETDMFKSIFNDLGISNKNTQSKLVDIRNKTQGLVNQSKDIAKAISKTINNAKIENDVLEDISNSRISTNYFKHGLEAILKSDEIKIARKYNIDEKELFDLKKNIGEGSSINKYKNIQQLFRANAKKIGGKNYYGFTNDIEKLISKQYLESNPKLYETIKKIETDENIKLAMQTIKSIEDVETAIFKDNIQYGYSGFYSPYKYEIKVAPKASQKELLKMSNEGWKQVDGDSYTFYRLDLSANVSDGIVPIQNNAFQGTIIKKDIEKNIKNLKEQGIPHSVEIGNDKTKTIRVYPDNKLAKELNYETDMVKKLSNKYISLSKTAIRTNVLKEIDKDVKSMFSNKPKEDFVMIDKDISPNFTDMFPNAKTTDILYVHKDFADILTGAKETLVTPDSMRNARMAEKVYKDMVKRFKRGVTVKSVSSILNNYVVIPSVLKMNGIPARQIPNAMRKAHLDYADFINGIQTYQEILAKHGKVKASKYMESFTKNNRVAKLSKDGGIQSALDDTLINIANETDHISYGLKSAVEKATNKNTADTFMNIVDFVNLSPNTSIGSFLMNKFVMADVVGRIALHNSLLKKGLTHSEAVAKTNDAFVNFSVPYPKSIRVLEEYGVPFIGWMYRMQVPLYKMIKENPVSVASIVGLYMYLESLGDDKKGYIGDLKMDSWFLHNSIGDYDMILNPDAIKDIRPQAVKELSGIIQGEKNPLELVGLNIK